MTTLITTVVNTPSAEIASKTFVAATYLPITGATTGATSQAQTFTNGVNLSNLTSGRIPFATTNGRLVDDADMTFATDTLTATKLSTGTFLSTATQTTTNGLTGTCVSSQPFQGTSYKKVVMYLTNFTSAGTVITFPTAFTNTPYVYGDAAAIAIAVTTTTTCTLTSVGAVAGNIIIEGF